MNAVLIC